MDTPPSSPDLVPLARANERAILEAIAKTFALPVGELRLAPEESFISESEGHPICFVALHATGMYGAYATANPDGSLGPMTCVAL